MTDYAEMLIYNYNMLSVDNAQAHSRRSKAVMSTEENLRKVAIGKVLVD